jgi:hypothetical protein
MSIWARHDGDPSFHSVAAIHFGGSLVTRCRGRWSTTDKWEEQSDPPHAQRCDACVRALIDLRCVTRGLDELASADQDDRSGLEHLFDTGGES